MKLYDTVGADLHNFVLSTKSIELHFDVYNKLMNGEKRLITPIKFNRILDETEISDGLEYFLKTDCFYSHVPKYA